MAAEQPKKIAGGAFGQFLKEQRPKLQAELKGKPVTEVTKLASTRFKALSDAERATYEQKYQQAKVQYEKDLAGFVAGGGEMKDRKRKGDKLDKKAAKKLKLKKKDANAPKKPAGGGYGCYLDKHRQAIMKEVAGQPITAVSKLAGTRWKALSEAERKPFEDAYQVKKAAYEAAMKTYVPPEVSEQEDAGGEKKLTKADKKEAKEEAKAAKGEAKEEKKAAKEKAKEDKKANKGVSAAAKAVANKKGGKNSGPPPVELQPAVLAKAQKAGLQDTLMKLAARDDVKASGKSQMDMLKALESSGGLLHAAKRALLD